MRLIVGGVLGVMTVCLFLRATDTRILIKQTIVKPGTTFVVDGYGDLGKGRSPSLVCQYFTGLGLTTVVFWYSPSNILGRDGCRFISREANNYGRRRA